MLSPPTRRRRSPLPAFLALLLLAAPAARAQTQTPELPDVAALEAQHEELFQAALDAPEDGEPSFALMRWGSVIMSAVMLEHVRRAELGEDAPAVDAEAVAERVLARWQELRPESTGPHVLRAAQNQDPAAKRAAVLAVHDRFPTDPLAVSQAVAVLMQAGEAERAGEVAEAYLIEAPDDPRGYRLRLQAVRDHETKRAEVLVRWAEATPGDPRLVGAWLASKLRQQEPGATRRVLGDFFARRPGGEADLGACLEAMRRAGGEWAAPARACVARTAGTPDLPPRSACCRRRSVRSAPRTTPTRRSPA